MSNTLDLTYLNTKKVLSYAEALNYTCFGDSTFRKLVSNGDVKCYKPTNGKVFFNREELEAWLLTNPNLTNEEIEREASTYVALKSSRR